MALRFYRFKDLKGVGIPFTFKHILDLERLGRFPKRAKLSTQTTVWVADEVDDWLRRKVSERGDVA
jgi:predicted DNA-binding transcriptional regulator AlpA